MLNPDEEAVLHIAREGSYSVDKLTDLVIKHYYFNGLSPYTGEVRKTIQNLQVKGKISINGTGHVIVC